MNDIAEFISAADRYAQRKGLATSTISRYIFNDGKVIERLKSGRTITIRRLSDAKQRLAALEAA